MKSLIFNLCDNRRVFVPDTQHDEFIAKCEELNLPIHGGIMLLANDPANPLRGTDCQCLYLEGPITHQEGRVIADYYNLAGEYDHCISKGMSVTEALAEWDLL